MNIKLCNTQVYSIPFFLDYCISVAKECCVLLSCSRSTLLVWFTKGSLFLEGFKVITVVYGVCNMVMIA